jgi:predicted ATPase
MTAVSQPSGTVTLVFSDIEGSTKLLEELGTDAYRDALAEHRRIVREAYGRYSGYEVDYEGDAFFYTFASASDAVAAVAEAMAGLADGPIAIRVGIHTGTPALDPPKYVGMDVHFAARVMSSAHGGQVVCSAATAAVVDLELTELGEHRLKDISEAVALFQLGEGSFPPLKTISNTNLPRPASSFLGRDAELAQVLTRIEQGARLLTLTGPGGTGKTRLALEAASTLVGAYKAGVLWVGLATLRDPTLVTETIAQTLGAKDDLASHIGERQMLLLLDNLEQVIESAPELSALLGVCPNLTLLVTSRELLRISGEVEYAVPPLAEPEALALFCERAQLEPSAEIAELCARLDSLPLAVELAAARTKALSPAQILERLSQRLDLLKGGRDSDPRQQTLRATIEWSYELLTPTEQLLFACLSVFTGGCTLEAAEEVAGADLDILQSLVEKSLLRFSTERYWMLETIREYAGEQLEGSGRTSSARLEHSGFFAALAAKGTAELRESPREWGDRLEAERSNLRAALAWSLDRDRAIDATELAMAYGSLCASRGPLGEGRSWLEVVLRQDVPLALRQKALRVASNLAERQKDLDAARAFAEESVELAQRIGDRDAIGAASLTLGIVEGDAGDFESSERLHREALNAFSEVGNEREVRTTLGMLGFLYISRGDYASARRVCEQALSMSRLANDKRGIALAASNLGHALAREGNAHAALELQREAVVLAWELMDLQGTCEILLDVAALAVAEERYEHGAMLLGGMTALAESGEFALMSVEVEWFEEILDVARNALGPDDLERVLVEGHSLQLDELVTYAVEFIDSSV